MSSDVESALKSASEIVGLIAVAPGPIGIVAKIATIALRAGSALVAAGKDPVVEITRMLSAKSEVEGVHSNWSDFLEKNWPPASSNTPLPDTESEPSMPAITGEDIYEEDDS